MKWPSRHSTIHWPFSRESFTAFLFLHSCGKEKENAIAINFVERLSCSNNSSLPRLYRLYDSQRFGGWLWAKTETFSIMFSLFLFLFFVWLGFYFLVCFSFQSLGGLFFFWSWLCFASFFSICSFSLPSSPVTLGLFTPRDARVAVISTVECCCSTPIDAFNEFRS